MVKTEVRYLSQFYTDSQIDYYAKGDYNKVKELYSLTQPKKVTIGSLKGKAHNSNILVSSPDGWVPVLDCIEKIKDSLYKFKFKSGIEITASHDHLYQQYNNEWKYARNLTVGDKLISDSGFDEISEIEDITKKTKVYDLSVNHDNHRYYTNTICSHNSGKSLFMQNIAVNWAEAGLNGIYLSLELSEELTALRMDSMITGMSTKEVFKELDSVELKIRMAGKKSGHIRIKYMPAQSNVNQIRAYIKELQIQSGIKMDFIMVDYLDLVMPVTAKVSPSDLFVKDKYVSEELRNLAKEVNMIMITASQLNRGAVEEIEFDHSHISGGLSKINTADNVFGIFTSRAMKERGRYQLQLMKTRSSNGVGTKIDLEYNVESMRITDPGEEGQGDGNGASRNVSNVLNGIKSTSTVTDAPKINAEVQSSKLKSMLSALKKTD